MLSFDPRPPELKPSFQAEVTLPLSAPIAPSLSLATPLPNDQRSPQPSIASPHQPASNVPQSRGMAQRSPPVLPARSSVLDPKPANAASTPRSMSSPTATRRKPPKSFLSLLLADRRRSSP